MVKVAGYDERLPLVQHLDELRRRIMWALGALVVGIIVAAVFNGFVFSLLLRPLNQERIPETARKITTFSPAEPFMTSLKVWVYVGLILASPVVIYEFWAYIGPAFAPEHKRMLLPVVAACTGLFLFGVVFGYLVVLPTGLAWLLGVNDQFFQVQNRAADYFSFSAWFLVAFGAVFEMPVVIVLLVRLGITDTRFLRRNRKYAVVINSVVAMVATPSQDPFSMIAMFIPLLVLYEAAIIVSRAVEGEPGIRPKGAVIGLAALAPVALAVAAALTKQSVHDARRFAWLLPVLAVYEGALLLAYIVVGRWAKSSQKETDAAVVEGGDDGDDSEGPTGDGLSRAPA